jgi:hypothetical protein
MKPIQKYVGFAFLLFLCGSHSLVSAGIRPSFDPDLCSWNATHVVVATEGKTIDGSFRVLESCKGDLNPGDIIKIPELASFKSQSSRAVADPWYEKEKSNQGVFVTGDRMILFLKKNSMEATSQRGDGSLPSPASIRWKSSDSYDDMSVSVAWIEQGKAFGFVQVMNPGPSLLIPLGLSEDELKSRALKVKDVQNSFLQAAAIANPANRAEALASFTHHPLYFARGAAFEALRKSGKAALPVVRSMLADDALLDIHGELVGVLAEAGNGDVGPDLTQLVVKGLDFWRVTGPALKRGWWNGKGFDSLEDALPLRERYMEVYEALLGLQKRPYRESETAVRQFRDFWGSLPQLRGDGLDQMTQACDEILRELDRLKSNANTISFEGLRVFDDSQILKTLREERIVTEGSPLGPEQIEQAQITIKKLMASRGYPHGTSVVRNDQSDPNLRALTFIVSEGEPVSVAEIRFAGNKIFSSSELNARTRKCLADEGNEGVNIYNAEGFDYCLRRLDDFARRKGYLQARFHDPETEETKDGMVINVHADEGILYKLGEITIEGARAVPVDRIRALLTLRTGDTANAEMIAKWLFEDLKRVYGEIGHIQYTADPEPEFKAAANGADEAVVDFKIAIDEGRQFRVHAIKFQRDGVSEKELQALFRIRPGDIFNQRLWEESIDELNKSGRFEFIDKDRDADFTTDEEQGLLDIVIKLNNHKIEPVESLLKLRQF